MCSSPFFPQIRRMVFEFPIIISTNLVVMHLLSYSSEVLSVLMSGDSSAPFSLRAAQDCLCSLSFSAEQTPIPILEADHGGDFPIVPRAY